MRENLIKSKEKLVEINLLKTKIEILENERSQYYANSGLFNCPNQSKVEIKKSFPEVCN